MNSHNVDSGAPVWNTSLTTDRVRSDPYVCVCVRETRVRLRRGSGKSRGTDPTFVKPIHVELPDKRGDVGVLEVLTQYFREFVGGRHDEALIRSRP